MELTSDQIQGLRKTELALLDEFSRVCSELGLRWFLVQGSLLGAVRHGGFIPWDDDIDVGMMRADHERFVREAQKLLPEWCFLQTHKTDPGYMQCYSKLRDSRTVFWETTYKNIDMNHGVYIDIFPFDEYPDDVLSTAWYEARKLLIRYRLRGMYYIPKDRKPSAANLARALLCRFSRLCYPTEEEAFQAQERIIRGARGRRLTSAGSPWGRRELLTAEGTVSAEFGAFAGKTKAELREAMLTALKDGGFLVKSEPCSIRKTVCRRCGSEVTKRIAAQWFLRSREFAEPAAEALRSGDLRIIPEQYTARCTERLTDARDQRISRHAQQGIPVPAFYCEACGKMTVTESDSALCPECGQPMQPDPDTLETGFAASLLPFALLGYPERTDDLQYYYPADTLVTGYDLVTPWVSGMLAAAMRQTDQMPFRQVLLHGLVRDSSGKKVTSARKNGYDPMALIEDYGADALRYALIARSAVGKDIRLSEAQVIAAKRLAEKLWNCARYVLGSVSGTFRYAGLPASLRIEEQWIVSRCNQLAGDVDADMERGAYGAAAERIGRFIRRTFSGTYLALAGARLRADVSGRAAAEQVLVWVLRRILCMMHPFMPFVTEEIWQALTDCESAVIAAEYPVYQSVLDFSQEADDFEQVLEALRAVKRSRKALHIPETLRAKFYFETMDVDLFSASRFFFEQLAGAREIEFGQDYRFRNAIHVVTDRAHIAIPLEQPLIRDREHARLMEEAELLRREAEQVQALLHQSGFTEKAPEQVVRAARERRAVLRERLVRLVEALS